MNDRRLWDGDIADGTEFGLWVAATGAFSREGAFFLPEPIQVVSSFPFRIVVNELWSVSN